MVDTGASATCVSASLPGIQAMHHEPADVRLVAANGSPLVCLGALWTDVMLGPGLIRHGIKVWVVQDLSAPGILGNDVLQKFGQFSVDFDARVLELAGHRLPLEARASGAPVHSVQVRLGHGCLLEPHSERVVEVSAVDFGADERDVVFEPDAASSLRLGVTLPATVVRSGPRNRMPLLVSNRGNQSVRLYDNMTLGEVTAIQVAEGEQSLRACRPGPAQVDLSSAEISEQEKVHAEKLFSRYRDTFANNDDELGQTHLRQFRIVTGDCPPVAVPARRTPYHLREEVAIQIRKMERQGVIQKSSSPWSAPLLLVKKGDGNYRFAIDYRALNAKTATEVAYLPTVRECLDSLAGSRLYTTLDLNSAYWQVPIVPEDRKKTAFCTETDHWEFLVMPYGLKNAPSCFTRLIADALRGLLGNGVTAYLDDIIIGGKSFQEHLSLLEAVLERLKQAGLTVKSKKVVACRRKLRFLGHLVGDGVEPDPEKVAVIRSWPRPTSTKELRSFLGLCAYYNDFVPDLQRVAAPLHRISGKAKFTWDAEREAAFEDLKRALIETTTLQFPNMQKEFEVSTDASDTGLGCVLSQRDDLGRDRPVCFASKAFTDNEKNWHIRDKEAFAFVVALRKFRPYLLGKKFKWFTDNRSLTWLHNTRDPRGRYARWLEEIQEFDFDVEYRRGVSNSHADAISRLPVCVTQEHEPQTLSMVNEADMVWAQQEDSRLKKLYSEIRLKRTSGPETVKWRKLGWEPKIEPGSGLLVATRKQKEILMVPEKFIPLALRLKHDDAGHFGAKRTEVLLRRAGYGWLTMKEDVKHFCRSCVTCAKANDPHRRYRAPLSATTQPTEAWQHVSLDLMGPIGVTHTARGNRFILVALDLLTKGVELVAIPDKSAKTVAEALVETVFYRHGLPESLLTDRGLEFDNRYFLTLARAVGIDRKKISAFHPQSNGAVERCNQTLGSLLRRMAQEKVGDWDDHLALVRFQYMTAEHRATGHSPFYLQFGRDPRTPRLTEKVEPTGRPPDANSWIERLTKELKEAHAAVVEREERTKRRRQELSSRNAHVARYKEGDLVFQRCPPKPGRPGKLQPRWDGPYIVVECRQGNVYLIKRADNFRRRYVRHHDRLKPFEGREERLAAPPPAGTAPAGEEREDGQRDPSDESSDSSPSLDEERTEQSSSASDESDEEAEAASGDPPPPRRGSRARRPASRWPEGQWTQ